MLSWSFEAPEFQQIQCAVLSVSRLIGGLLDDELPGVPHACFLHFKEFVSVGADELPPVTMSSDLGLGRKLHNLRDTFIQQRASGLLICAYSFRRWGGGTGREGGRGKYREKGRRERLYLGGVFTA